MFDNETARKQETLVIFGLEDYDHKWTEHTASPKKNYISHPTEQNSPSNETMDKEPHSCVQVLLKLIFLWHAECLGTE